jgi:hypothetical protein
VVCSLCFDVDINISDTSKKIKLLTGWLTAKELIKIVPNTWTWQRCSEDAAIWLNNHESVGKWVSQGLNPGGLVANGKPLPHKLLLILISDTTTPTYNQISGLITRAHAHQLNNQVSSFLASYSSYLYKGNVCSILLLRNNGQEGNGVAFTPATFGFQNSSNLWQPPGPRMDLNSGVQILSRKLLESTFICIKLEVHIISEPTAIVILVHRPFSSNGVVTPYFGPLGRVSY